MYIMYIRIITCLNIACGLLAEHLECALFVCIATPKRRSCQHGCMYPDKTPVVAIKENMEHKLL